MNDLTKGLWYKAGMGYNEQHVDPMVIDEFVALIIKECSKECSKVLGKESSEAKYLARRIHEHFGVER